MGQGSMQKAVSLAEEYLLCYIEENGKWQDFFIEEPGISDQWVTAYVGSCLLKAPDKESPRVVRALEKAADFLRGSIREDGGWGYNGRCTSDCDSTAQAISFLSEMGQVPERKSLELLCRFWRQDGGFCTYLGNGKGSWNDSHIDVTLYAAVLLRQTFLHNQEAQERLHGYLSSWFDKGLPPAFWWKSDYYTALAGISCFQSFGWEYPKGNVLRETDKKIPENVYDLALYLDLISRLEDGRSHVEEACSVLCSRQRPDGSFSGGGILRVTATGCHRPWEDGVHEYAEDISSVYTTAASLKALLHAEKVLQ